MRRKIYDDQKHAQCVTFSCYKRCTLLKQVGVAISLRSAADAPRYRPCSLMNVTDDEMMR